MPSSIFGDLVIAGVILYTLWLFHQLIRNTIIIHAAKEKYLALYELKVVERELKERDLTFEDLDEFALRFVKVEKQGRIASIEEQYDVEAKPSKKEKETKK